MTFYRLWVKANTRAEAEGYIYTHLDLEAKPRFEPRPVGEPQEYVYTVETSSYEALTAWGHEESKAMGALLHFVTLREKSDV